MSLLFLVVLTWCIVPVRTVTAAEKGTSTSGQKSPGGVKPDDEPFIVEEDDSDAVSPDQKKKSESAGTQGLLKVEEIDEPLERLESKNPRESAIPAPEPEQKSPSQNASADSEADPSEIPLGKILVTELKVENVSIEIHAEERIEDYNVFTLTGPSRLVIEISNAVFRLGTNSMVINKFGISAARFEHHPKFLRIFLDAESGRILPYRIEETDASLNIILTNF